MLPESVASFMMNQLSALAANQGGLASGMTPEQYLDLVTAGGKGRVGQHATQSGLWLNVLPQCIGQ